MRKKFIRSPPKFDVSAFIVQYFSKRFVLPWNHSSYSSFHSFFIMNNTAFGSYADDSASYTINDNENVIQRFQSASKNLFHWSSDKK